MKLSYSKPVNPYRAFWVSYYFICSFEDHLFLLTARLKKLSEKDKDVYSPYALASYNLTNYRRASQKHTPINVAICANK